MRDAGFIDRAHELGIASALGVYASVIAGANSIHPICGCVDRGFMEDDSNEPQGVHDRKCGHAIILDYFGDSIAKAAAVEIAHAYALWAEQTSGDSNARYSEVMRARAFTGRKL